MFLFFFAGLELVEHRVARRSLVRGSDRLGDLTWRSASSSASRCTQAGLDAEAWLLGVALSTTALGTLVPILADAGLLPTPLGSAVLGAGVAGEFWPIVVISIFLTGAYGAVTETLLLVGFGAVVLLAAAAALRARPPRVVGILQQTVHTTGQAAVRLAVLSLAALRLPRHRGRVRLRARRVRRRAGRRACALHSPEGAPVRMRLEGVGFGFLIPIYFVVTGMTFDLDSLLSATGAGARGALPRALRRHPRRSALLWLRELGARQDRSLAIFSATGLPLIVAIVGIGDEPGAIANDVGTSLIGAGMVSVLVLPLLATAVATRESSRLGDAEPTSPA